MKIEDALKQKSFASPVQKAMVNILYTSVWLHQKQAEVFKPYGLSSQQYNVMRILRGQHPNAASVKLVAGRMIDKSSNVSRLVEKLRAKNYIERTPSANDRRQVDILITDLGLEVLKELDTQLSQRQLKLCGLNEEQLEQLSDLLDQLRSSEEQA